MGASASPHCTHLTVGVASNTNFCFHPCFLTKDHRPFVPPFCSPPFSVTVSAFELPSLEPPAFCQVRWRLCPSGVPQTYYSNTVRWRLGPCKVPYTLRCTKPGEPLFCHLATIPFLPGRAHHFLFLFAQP